MNRLLVGIMLLAIVCIAGSCTDEDEYTQGQWMKKASYNGVYRAYASGFTHRQLWIFVWRLLRSEQGLPERPLGV